MSGRLAIAGVLAALLGAMALASCNPATPANNQPAANTAPTPANTAPGASAAQDPAAAAEVKAFLLGLYDHYKSSKNNSFQMFDKDAKEVFDADMIALLAEDQKALKGELGTVDGDWLCDCQDFASLKATVAVQSATPVTATATSDFVDVGMPGQGPRHDAFQLVKVNGAWRIHDIKSGDQDWLRKQLQDEIKGLTTGKSQHAPDDAPAP